MLDCSANSGLGVQSSSPSCTAWFMNSLLPLRLLGSAADGAALSASAVGGPATWEQRPKPILHLPRSGGTASGEARQPFEHSLGDRILRNLREMEIDAADCRRPSSTPEIMSECDPVRQSVKHPVHSDHESQIGWRSARKRGGSRKLQADVPFVMDSDVVDGLVGAQVLDGSGLILGGLLQQDGVQPDLAEGAQEVGHVHRGGIGLVLAYLNLFAMPMPIGQRHPGARRRQGERKQAADG